MNTLNVKQGEGASSWSGQGTVGLHPTGTEKEETNGDQDFDCAEL